MSRESIVRNQPQQAVFSPLRGGILQRKCACGQHTVAGGECAECRKKRLQRKAAGHSDPETVPSIVHEVLHSPGRPLDDDTRSFMEERFGQDFSGVQAHTAKSQIATSGLMVGPVNDRFEREADEVAGIIMRKAPLLASPRSVLQTRSNFSQVRVHTDAKAVESARAVNALAYTVGQHVVFGENGYQPQTSSGRQLLAHELTHVVQQNASTRVLNSLQRSVGAGSSCPANVHNAPADPIAALTGIDARAQTMALGTSHVLFVESLLFNDPTFGRSYVFNAYRDWFGTPQPTSSGRWRSRFRTATFATEEEAMAHEMQTLSDRFERIHRWIAGNIRYRCPGTSRYTIPGCSPGVCRADAESCPGSRTIGICPTFWTGTTDDGRASLLLHEAIHALFHFPGHPTADVRGRGRNPGCYQGFVDTIYNTGALPGECNVI